MEQELEEKAKRLREELKYGRASEASRTADEDRTGHDQQNGTDIQTSRGTTRRTATTRSRHESGHRERENGDRSGTPDDQGFRSSSGRPRVNHSRIGESEQVGSPYANIEITEQPKERRGDFGERDALLDTLLGSGGRIRNQTIAEKLGVSLDEAKALRKAWKGKKLVEELPLARDRKAELRETISFDADIADGLLWHQEKRAFGESSEQPIWSDLDDKELERLSFVLDRLATRFKVAHTVIEHYLGAHDYLIAGAIVLPRLHRTIDVIRATRQKT